MKYSQIIQIAAIAIFAFCSGTNDLQAGGFVTKLPSAPKQKTIDESQVDTRLSNIERRLQLLELELSQIKHSNRHRYNQIFQPYGTYSSNTYIVTFYNGYNFKLVYSRSGRSYTGTYTIKDKIIICDLGSSKEVFEIIDDNTLSTTYNGSRIQLIK